jgi:cystathionine beta-lyase
VVSALDNTWGAGMAFNGFDLGHRAAARRQRRDSVVQALTKYPSGGGDVLMGSIVTRDEALHQRSS